MMAEEQQIAQQQNWNMMSPSSIQIRLDTKEILESIKTYLSGQQTISVPKDGRVEYVVMSVGKRLMNEEGVGHYVNYVSSIINPAVVQGNYTDDWYRMNLELTHKRLAKILVVNTRSWGINRPDRTSIIGFTMEIVKGFMSRLIENKERESYGLTMKSLETNRVQGNPTLLNRFGL
jgi:hypothetical protein